MARFRTLLVALLCLPAVAWSQQLLVFPVVTDEVPGENDSLWVTRVRLVKVDPRDTVTVRRTWVCLPGGGFVDDPASAPTWNLAAGTVAGRLLIAWGDQLLSGGSSDVGAVALEVEGGEVLAHSYVVDVLRGSYHPPLWAFGPGQYVAALREPLQGPSHIPWLGGCQSKPCWPAEPGSWSFFRDNIGIVNPNPVLLTVHGTVLPFVSTTAWGYGEWPDEDPETFVKQIPAYGWVQFHWAETHYYGSPFTDVSPPEAGFVISLTPDQDLPYYAYASVVFSPDPASGVPAFSAPMYVPAEPGYVAPFAEVYPPP